MLSLLTVTPFNILNSDALANTLSKSFIFAAALALNVVPSKLILSTVNTPLIVVGLLTVNAFVSSDNNVGLPLCPILLATVNEPALIVLPPISILPKLLVIDPDSRAPTVVIDVLPAFRLYR